MEISLSATSSPAAAGRGEQDAPKPPEQQPGLSHSSCCCLAHSPQAPAMHRKMTLHTQTSKRAFFFCISDHLSHKGWEAKQLTIIPHFSTLLISETTQLRLSSLCHGFQGEKERYIGIPHQLGPLTEESLIKFLLEVEKAIAKGKFESESHGWKRELITRTLVFYSQLCT